MASSDPTSSAENAANTPEQQPTQPPEVPTDAVTPPLAVTGETNAPGETVTPAANETTSSATGETPTPIASESSGTEASEAAPITAGEATQTVAGESAASGETVSTSGETPSTVPPAKEVVSAPNAGKRSFALPALPPQPVPQVPPTPQPHDLSRIAQDLQIRKTQVEAVVQLLDEENTVAFITRYRKERTGGLNEEVIRRIQERIVHLRELNARKQTILKSIAGQGRLNDELTQAILAAESLKRLEDLYQPFKPKKKSLATEAREKGLGPLAEAIWKGDSAVAKLDEVLPGLVDPDKWLLNVEDVLAGVKHVLADMVSDAADVRGPLRAYTWDTGLIVAVKVETLSEGKGKEYEPYFNFKEPVKEIPPHRVLAINRGEKANALRVRIETDVALANEIAAYHLNLGDHPHRELLIGVIAESLDRLVLPSLEREIRRDLTERAQDHAVVVFAKNLRSLLLQPPLRGKKVLAVDPGIRTGCKLAVLDDTGKLIEDAVVYPHGQKKNAADARRKMEQLIRKYQISVVAIGNGTGCRETEQVVADLIADLEQRRLNPAPTAPLTSSEASSPTVATPIETPPGEATTPTHPALLPDTQQIATESIVSDSVISSADTLTLTSIVTITSAPTETTEVHPPTAETMTTDTHSPAVHPTTTALTTAVPTIPSTPPISLEGLADAPSDLAYVIVNEAGASDYSASLIAREEFPDLDATTRGTISIGRRLQDPLAELVKIDPQHIGVGLYQHDVKQKQLKDSLEAVIGSCVNTVGVDLNTASFPLLRHVSGLNQLVAREVVSLRERNGKFTSREQLLHVPGLGEKRYIQAAGFLKISNSSDPLDATWIHPESYPLARQILAELGLSPVELLDRAKLDEIRGKFTGLNPAELAARLNVGELTIRDILDALAKPGRDPREDLPPPIFKKGVLKLEDIAQGMELKGTVLNVVPFGAFVDIGLKESGLVHISQMANRYIKSPYDVVSVGDVITVWVMEVKAGEKKISLSMIPPGLERRAGVGRFAGPPRSQGPGPMTAPMPQPQQQPPQPGDRPSFQPRGDRPSFQPRGDRPSFQPRGDRPPSPPRGFGQGPGGQFGGRGPGGRGPGGPPRQGVGPSPQPPAGAPSTESSAPVQPPPPIQPPPPPYRKPQAKPKPLPNLSAEKKSGKAALNTFAELAAFFKKEEAKPEPKPEEKKTGSQAEIEPKPEATKTEQETQIVPQSNEIKPEEPKAEVEAKIDPNVEESKPPTEQPPT